MKEKQLTVKTSILEKQNELDEYVNDTIIRNEKLLITSATGTYKTTYAAELVKEKGDNYFFVILEPQKTISGQLSIKLENEGVKAFAYNGVTRWNLKRWTYENKISGSFCIVI